MFKSSYLNYEKKAFFISFLIYSTLFGSYLLYKHYNPIKIESKREVISMQLSSFELPKQNSVVPTQAIEKTKAIEKPIEKNKPVEKPKAITPAKPIEKIIKKPIEKPIEKPKEILKEEIAQPIEEKTSKSQEQKSIEREPEKITHEQNFVKTNFAIIRNKVLSTLIYPNVAKRMGWVGVVELAIVIDTNGKLLDVYIYKSSNRELLDTAALKSAMKLKNQNLPKPQMVSTLILPVSFRVN
ncbi:MAG: TonB family protein [Arcobacteraceae bacterium]